MNPNILLLQPPIQDFYTTPIRLYPLGLLQIATPLEQAGYKVKILDCHLGFKRKIIPVPEKFRHIKKYYDERNKSPFRLFGNYYHFGMTYDEIKENIRTYKPDIVGISCCFSPYYETALKCAEIAKEVNPKIITVMGGTHASAMPETLTNNSAVDFIIKGEAEIIFKEFISNSKINNGYNIVDDLDSLPFNNLALISRKDMAMIQTSRGCPLKCSFCSIPGNPGHIYRVKSPKRVIEEILHHHKKFGINHIDIEDDNFTADMDRGLKILDLIIKHAKIKLSAMNGLSYIYLNKKLLQKMKTAGFRKINLSMPSLKQQNSTSHFENIVLEANHLGIDVEVHFIVGLPDEKPEDTMDTLRYLAKLPCRIGGSIFYPVPNTPLFNKINKPSDPSFWRLTLACTEAYPDARKDQITFLYLVRMINFMKGKKSHPLGSQLVEKFLKTGKIYKALKRKNEYIFQEEPLDEDILKKASGILKKGD